MMEEGRDRGVNYREHPAFGAYHDHSLALPEAYLDTLANFNVPYLFFEEGELELLAKSPYVKSLAMMKARLSRAFAPVVTLRDDDRWRAFCSELEAECTRILEEDWSHFCRRRLGKVSQTPESMVGSGGLLEHDAIMRFRLDDDSVSELNDNFATSLAQFREKAIRGMRKRSDLSANAGTAVEKGVRIVQRELAANGVLDAMSNYMGTPCRVAGLAVELSVAGSDWWDVKYQEMEQSPKTLYYHYDETRSAPKAIVYLSDVEPSSGPFQWIHRSWTVVRPSGLQSLVGRAIVGLGRDPSSSLYGTYSHVYHQPFGDAKFREDFACLPRQFQFNSHFGWDVVPGSHLEESLLDLERSLVGCAGSGVAFDGSRLLHRGGLVDSGDRVALQIVFTRVTPLARRVLDRASGVIRSAK